MHFFTVASEALGPPSAFIVRSVVPDAKVSINWTRLLDYHKYDAIKVERAFQTYGLTFFSVS